MAEHPKMEKALTIVRRTFVAAMNQIDADETLRECATFATLHDHCDANLLGGIGDDEDYWGDPDFYDPESGFTALGAFVTNEWQNRVDTVLRARALSLPMRRKPATFRPGGYIGNTVLRYPARVALPAEPFGWRIYAWADFAAANPDIADDVALQIAMHGQANVGGGAAPEITIMRG